MAFSSIQLRESVERGVWDGVPFNIEEVNIFCSPNDIDEGAFTLQTLPRALFLAGIQGALDAARESKLFGGRSGEKASLEQHRGFLHIMSKFGFSNAEITRALKFKVLFTRAEIVALVAERKAELLEDLYTEEEDKGTSRKRLVVTYVFSSDGERAGEFKSLAKAADYIAALHPFPSACWSRAYQTVIRGYGKGGHG